MSTSAQTKINSSNNLVDVQSPLTATALWEDALLERWKELKRVFEQLFKVSPLEQFRREFDECVENSYSSWFFCWGDYNNHIKNEVAKSLRAHGLYKLYGHCWNDCKFTPDEILSKVRKYGEQLIERGQSVLVTRTWITSQAERIIEGLAEAIRIIKVSPLEQFRREFDECVENSYSSWSLYCGGYTSIRDEVADSLWAHRLHRLYRGWRYGFGFTPAGILNKVRTYGEQLIERGQSVLVTRTWITSEAKRIIKGLAHANSFMYVLNTWDEGNGYTYQCNCYPIRIGIGTGTGKTEAAFALLGLLRNWHLPISIGSNNLHSFENREHSETTSPGLLAAYCFDYFTSGSSSITRNAHPSIIYWEGLHYIITSNRRLSFIETLERLRQLLFEVQPITDRQRGFVVAESTSCNINIWTDFCFTEGWKLTLRNSFLCVPTTSLRGRLRSLLAKNPLLEYLHNLVVKQIDRSASSKESYCSDLCLIDIPGVTVGFKGNTSSKVRDTLLISFNTTVDAGVDVEINSSNFKVGDVGNFIQRVGWLRSNSWNYFGKVHSCSPNTYEFQPLRFIWRLIDETNFSPLSKLTNSSKDICSKDQIVCNWSLWHVEPEVQFSVLLKEIKLMAVLENYLTIQSVISSPIAALASDVQGTLFLCCIGSCLSKMVCITNVGTSINLYYALDRTFILENADFITLTKVLNLLSVLPITVLHHQENKYEVFPLMDSLLSMFFSMCAISSAMMNADNHSNNAPYGNRFSHLGSVCCFQKMREDIIVDSSVSVLA
jgi:hypothetical protein